MNRRHFLISILIYTILAGLSPACTRDRLSPADFMSRQEADSLLTDMVSFIYSKPPYSDYKTRFNPEFRNYYIKNAAQFKFEYYSVTPDSLSYFFLIRPARTLKGNLRGVGGKFRLDPYEKGTARLRDFEEIFNTVVMPEDSLRKYGYRIMKYLVKHGNLDPFLYDPAITEWPDRNTRYDTIRHEWRYFPKDSVPSSGNR